MKLDTKTNITISWFQSYVAPVSPIFVPRSADQGADEDAGALLVLLIPSGETPNASLDIPPRQNRAVLLDAATLGELCSFVLPVAPLSAAGLHNYYAGEVSSV